MKTLSLGLATLLVACTGSPQAAAEGSNASAVAPTVGQAAPPTAPSAPPPEVAFRQSIQTPQLDFELSIPAEAAALPALKARLLEEAARGKAETLAQQADYVREVPDGAGRTFGWQAEWSVQGATAGLLSLVGQLSAYTGGAHGSAGTAPILWDRVRDREVTLDALFTDKAKALATMRTAYCRALDQQRAERRGTAGVETKLGGEFDACPPFDQLTVAPSGNVGGKFSRIAIVADPYVAGPWAEGAYEVELLIPKAMVAFVAPPYRASFPG